MRAPEWHTTKHARTPLYGRKLEHGDMIEQGDLYDSTTGLWTQHPCVGSEVSGQTKLATTVRPVDPDPPLGTWSAWSDVMGDEDLPTVPLGTTELQVMAEAEKAAVLDHKVELRCGYTTVPQEMLDDGVLLVTRAAGKDVRPKPESTQWGPQLARALDDRHRPTSAIGGMRLIDHKWPPMEENLGEMEERKVEPRVFGVKDGQALVRFPNGEVTVIPEIDRPDLTAEDIEEARRLGTGPAMEPPDEVA